MNVSPEVEAVARSIDNIDTTGEVWEHDPDDQLGYRESLAKDASKILERLAELGWKVVRADA